MARVIERLDAHVLQVPTDGPEADGTIAWDETTHTAPALHLHPACALGRLIHVEYFWDHQRVERLVLDGLPATRAGALWPDLGQPGNGLSLRADAAERFAV